MKKRKNKRFPFKHGEADDSPGFLLWKIVTLWQEKLAGIFGELAITQTQYALLASLAWFDQRLERPTQSKLCGHARIGKMALSKAVRNLERRALVLRKSSAIDTRAIQIRFTASGRELTHRAIIAVERADDEFFSCLTGRQLASYKALSVSIIAGNRSRSNARDQARG